MPFLAQACVDHGGSSTDPSAVCCPGYTIWDYDAKTGVPYTGMMCWTAACAGAGQWAGPGGVGDHCCSGLVNVGGKCATPTSTTPPPSGGGGGIYTPPPSSGGGFFDSLDLDSTTMMMIGGGLLLLLMMGGKKK